MKAVLALGITVALLLSGCSSRESYETAIPAALLAADLGINYAEADTNLSGFATSLSVYVEFDRDTVTADDLREIIEISVANNDLDRLSALRISGVNGPIEVDYKPVDLASPGEELGFPEHSSSPGNFYAKWADVVDFTKN